MPIWSLTHERVQKLQAEAASQADLVRRLTATTNRQMWAQDLDEFMQVGWVRRGGAARGAVSDTCATNLLQHADWQRCFALLPVLGI